MTAAILITGASSGLGAALAEAYAEPGTLLFLGGRDADRLAEVAALCRARGADVHAQTVDVTDREATERWVLSAEAEQPLTLVIANAGISGGTGNKLGETAEQARAIFSTNIDGVMNTVLPIIPKMQARKSGQIVLMSSQAGFRGMPGAPAYCGSKAAVRVWGEGMRVWLAKDKVAVTVVCPGFVETALTAKNRFHMPFLMGVAQAAAIMKKGIDAKRSRVAFPWQTSAATWLLATLPPSWSDRILTKTPGK